MSYVAVFVLKALEPGQETPSAGMAGRTIGHPRHGVVFLHQHSGTQFHGATRCPCPVDAVLLDWLADEGIRLFYAHDRKQGTLLRAKVGDLLTAPTLADGGRIRHYLPLDHWDSQDGVTEDRGRGKTVLSVGGEPRLVWRFTQEQVVLDPFAAVV